MCFSILGGDCVALLREDFVLRLLCSYPLVLQEVAVYLGQVFHQAALFMVCLQQSILVRSELLQLRLEQLILLVGDCLLVEDENVGDIVVVDLTA